MWRPDATGTVDGARDGARPSTDASTILRGAARRHHPRGMHSDIRTALDVFGFVTRPQILDCGHDDRTITAAVRAGTLVRVGPGLFVGPEYRRLSPEQQHVRRARAVASRFADRIVFSHHTAALLHGGSTWGIDLRSVHATRSDTGRGRRQAGVVHHVGTLDDDEVTEVDGLLVTTPARTAWDVAVSQPREQGVVAVDSLLNHGLVDDDALRDQCRRHAQWTRARHAKTTLTHTDGAADSVGESRGRLLFQEHRLPRPELQLKIFDRDGVLVGISDFGWPEFRHLAEFDGMVKYGSGLDLAREKAREDAIRRLGWGMTRFIWSQLGGRQRVLLARELHDAMRQSRRLFVSVA